MDIFFEKKNWGENLNQNTTPSQTCFRHPDPEPPGEFRGHANGFLTFYGQGAEKDVFIQPTGRSLGGFEGKAWWIPLLDISSFFVGSIGVDCCFFLVFLCFFWVGCLFDVHVVVVVVVVVVVWYWKADACLDCFWEMESSDLGCEFCLSCWPKVNGQVVYQFDLRTRGGVVAFTCLGN